MRYVYGKKLKSFKDKLISGFAGLVLLTNSVGVAIPALFANQHVAATPGTAVYDALASTSPSTNYPSYGLQAHSIGEYGDLVTLGGTNRQLNDVSVTMSNWAKKSGNTAWCTTHSTKCGDDGFTHPITISLYTADETLITSKTQESFIPWRPESDPDCTYSGASNGPGWKEGGTCVNVSGLAANVTVDFSSSNVVLPNQVLVAISYPVQSDRKLPGLGVAGPYNSLNFTFPLNNTPSIGSDDQITSFAAASWTNGYNGGLTEFTTNAGYGTVAFKITASAVDTSSTTFVNDPKYVRANTGGDLAAQIVTPDSTEDVRFYVDGGSTPISGSNVGGAGSTTSWWRLYTPLAAGEHEISAQIKIGGNWFGVGDTGVVYSIDLPTAQYVLPSSTANVFRGSDNPIRVRVEDQFEQFNRMLVTVGGSTYEVTRANCDLRQAGNYLLCDVDASTTWTDLAPGVYTASTTTYTKANNRVDNLLSLSFTVDDTAPVVVSSAIENDINGVIKSVANVVAETTDNIGVESVNFYVAEPRFDGVCTGNGTKLAEFRQTTPGGDGKYRANLDISSLDGEYCVTVVARDTASNNSTLKHHKIVFDNTAPDVFIVSPVVDLTNTSQEVRVTVQDPNLRHYWVHITRNGSLFLNETVLSASVTNELVATLSDDGNYVITLAARDNAGGGSSTGNRSGDVVKSITIDKTAPVGTATYSGGTEVSGVRYVQSIDDLSFTETITDLNGVVRATFLVQKLNTGTSLFEGFCGNWNANSLGSHVLGGSTNEVYTENNIKACVSDPSKWTDGTYKIFHAAYDAAGNEGKYNTNRQIFVIDSTAPSAPTGLNYTTTSGAVLASGDVTNETTGLFDWGDVSDAVKYGLYTWNENPSSPSYAADFSGRHFASWFTDSQVPGDLEFQQAGEELQHVCITAVDAAGNESACSTTFSLTLDLTAPVVSILSYTTAGNVITPVVEVAEANGPVTYSWNTLTGVTISDTSAEEPTFTVNTDGTYNFVLTTTDVAGNITNTPFSFTYNTPTTPPTSSTGGNTNNDDENENDTDGDGFTNVDTGVLAATDESSEEDAEALAATDETPSDTNGTQTGDLENDTVKEEGCSKFWGICWYYWIPGVVIVLMVIYYLSRRRSDKE